MAEHVPSTRKAVKAFEKRWEEEELKRNVSRGRADELPQQRRLEETSEIERAAAARYQQRLESARAEERKYEEARLRLE